MHVAVVYFTEKNNGRLARISEALKQGLEEQGASVALINGYKEKGTGLTAYKYLAFGCESSSFFGKKLPSSVKQFLNQAGTIAGKRCLAYTTSRLFFTQKTLTALMNVMEQEGLYLKNSEAFASADVARLSGKKLHLK